MRKINRLSHQVKATGDPRSIDQIRADIFLDLLKGRDQQTGTSRAVVDIQVDLTTLLQLDEKPGELPGWGPVIADISRQVVDEQHERNGGTPSPMRAAWYPAGPPDADLAPV